MKEGNEDGNADTRVAIIVFSWGAVTHQHFTSDIASAINTVEGLAWPNSVTFTHEALWKADSELGYARWWAHSSVILLTDGWPYFYWYTWWAAWQLKWKARLTVVPITPWA